MLNKKSFKGLNTIKNHLISYPTPSTISYAWSFGSLAGIFLSIQILTGIILAVQYIAETDIAFEIIERIMRDVNNGYFLRYMHANSASFFFICIYIHILRGLFYKSYSSPRQFIWLSGIIVLLISILTAFLGYVLPWGQMSYWAATVITNLVTAVPVVGKFIVYWLWGDYTVSGYTLTRFFNLHYFLAIILITLVIIHLTLVHEIGSSTPLIPNNKDFIVFYRYLYLKDLFSLFIMLIAFCVILFYFPNILGHTDNYIKSNSMVTPTHIVPEWYFLPFYAILRSIDNKLFGVIAMIFSILILGSLVTIKNYYKVELFYNNVFFQNWFFWCFFTIVIILGIIGGLPAEYPYIYFGKLFTFLYFAIFILLQIESICITKCISILKN